MVMVIVAIKLCRLVNMSRGWGMSLQKLYSCFALPIIVAIKVHYLTSCIKFVLLEFLRQMIDKLTLLDVRCYCYIEDMSEVLSL